MMRDLRLALRTLGKTPGPTAVVVGTLAVALAAGTVVYSTHRHRRPPRADRESRPHGVHRVD
jgi:hypothetical protein